MEDFDIPHFLLILLRQRRTRMQKLLICLSIFSISLLVNVAPAQAQDASPFELPPRLTADVARAAGAAQAQQAVASVDLASRQESLDFFQAVYRASEGATMEWTGDHAACNPGQVSPYYREAILRRINYFRAMAGVPADVVFTDEYNAAAQEAALMMSVNNKLSHGPEPDWTCYTENGATAAGRSNLFLSTYLANPVDGYIKDPGGGNYFVGHRRWILHPQTLEMGTGDVPTVNGFPAANALWVIDSNTFADRPPTRDGFVAWPPPGYVPYQVVFARWSFSYPNADFSAANVAMQRNGESISVSLDGPAEEGFGENTLVWIPMGLNDGYDWEKPAADTAYSVTISNVLIDGAARNFSYTVTIFDPDVEILDPAASSITLNAEVGAPGSFFTVVGRNYSPGEVVDVSVNGNRLATVSADDGGSFAAILNTEGVDTGVFKMSAASVGAVQAASVASTNASTYFTLDATAPPQAKYIPPDAPIPVELELADAFEVNVIYLPTIRK